MAKRGGGFIGQDGINAPDPATGVEASAGDEQASVSFTSPSDEGGADVTEYRVTDSTGAFGASGSSSPITVTGLTNGTSYTFNVWAINPFGWSSPSDASGSVSPQPPARFVLAGGVAPSSNVIEYTTEGTSGTWADFGDLTVARYNLTASPSSTTRAVFGGGEDSGGSLSNVMDYVTIASTGNATDFGDLSLMKSGGASNGTKGLFIGGTTNSSNNTTSAVYEITIASTGNASYFATLTVERAMGASATSPTRVLYAGGYSDGQGTRYDIIDYHSYTSGSFSDFGDLSSSRSEVAGASNSTRAVFAGGYDGGSGFGVNVIEYVEIASTGNTTDFGDLTYNSRRAAMGSGRQYAIYQGGTSGSYFTQYLNYNTLGNAQDFGGSTSVVRNQGHTIASNGHGGLS